MDKAVKAFYPPGLGSPLMPIDATQPYDESNVFARILRKEIPCRAVYEDEHALAFHDIAPAAPVHHCGQSLASGDNRPRQRKTSKGE